ncbi:unnamed protein product [Prorocentrum cordatum]|uniref:Uncharacterized protein n=1 Tax=Prorocentrum cordatum TaxID=2364126 RepID=A0ABN9U770_9DINO|nr:unnamed protein product [Polarella glacialis]
MRGTSKEASCTAGRETGPGTQGSGRMRGRGGGAGETRMGGEARERATTRPRPRTGARAPTARRRPGRGRATGALAGPAAAARGRAQGSRLAIARTGPEGNSAHVRAVPGHGLRGRAEAAANKHAARQASSAPRGEEGGRVGVHARGEHDDVPDVSPESGAVG